MTWSTPGRWTSSFHRSLGRNVCVMNRETASLDCHSPSLALVERFRQKFYQNSAALSPDFTYINLLLDLKRWRP